MPDKTPRDRAQAGYTLFLQRLPTGTAKNVAKEMGISDSQLSELKNKHVEPVMLLLAHLGLKVVDSANRCVTPQVYEFLISTHERMVRQAPALVWGDDE